MLCRQILSIAVKLDIIVQLILGNLLTQNRQIIVTDFGTSHIFTKMFKCFANGFLVACLNFKVMRKVSGAQCKGSRSSTHSQIYHNLHQKLVQIMLHICFSRTQATKRCATFIKRRASYLKCFTSAYFGFRPPYETPILVNFPLCAQPYATASQPSSSVWVAGCLAVSVWPFQLQNLK